MTPLYVFDLDGTLANIEHRLPFIDSTGKKSWNKFFESCDQDKPIRWTIDLLNNLKRSGASATKYFSQSEVLILTGRNETVKEKTVEWLRKYNVFYDYIVMRPSKDYTPDYILKKRLLEEFLRDKDFDVKFIVEDRQRIVDMWRESGYNVLQCDAWNE